MTGGDCAIRAACLDDAPAIATPVLDNPGGGSATYLRHAWADPAQMAARCRW